MNSNESVLVFLRFVKEKHSHLVNSLDALVQALVGEKTDQKIAHAQKAAQTANDLLSAIAVQDRPSWLLTLIHALNSFASVSSSNNKNNLVIYLFSTLSEIKAHVWSFENTNDKSFDFDAIFEHYKSESRIPELFDEIIRILEEIEASGEIDSLSMLNSLGKVLATLKKNRNGSYFSLNSAWDFLVSFLQNYMWVELSKLPVLGSAMEALEKTIKEANEEMFKLHVNVEKKMSETVESEIKALKGKSAFPFVSYDRSGVELSNDSSSVHKIDRRV